MSCRCSRCCFLSCLSCARWASTYAFELTGVDRPGEESLGLAASLRVSGHTHITGMASGLRQVPNLVKKTIPKLLWGFVNAVSLEMTKSDARPRPTTQAGHFSPCNAPRNNTTEAQCVWRYQHHVSNT